MSGKGKSTGFKITAFILCLTLLFGELRLSVHATEADGINSGYGVIQDSTQQTMKDSAAASASLPQGPDSGSGNGQSSATAKEAAPAPDADDPSGQTGDASNQPGNTEGGDPAAAPDTAIETENNRDQENEASGQQAQTQETSDEEAKTGEDAEKTASAGGEIEGRDGQDQTGETSGDEAQTEEEAEKTASTAEKSSGEQEQNEASSDNSGEAGISAEKNSVGENPGEMPVNPEEADPSKRINGMPESFELTVEELALKADSAGHQVADELLTLEEGKDYVQNEVFFLTDSEEYAKQVAYAVNGVLKEFEYGVAVITLDPEILTVQEAVKLSEDPESNLPLLNPNHITQLIEPEPEDSSHTSSFAVSNLASSGTASPYQWNRFYNNSSYTNKDPKLNPTDGEYQWMHDYIGSYAAWELTGLQKDDWSLSSKDITVAVIDSGTGKSEHNDLNVINYTKIAETASTRGDNTGHSTHVCGIIGAKLNNGIGGAGIAPGIRIISYGITNPNGRMEYSDVIKAINAVINDGEPKADIINMSLGGPIYDAGMQSAVKSAYNSGITIVAAMGNAFSNIKEYPAAFEDYVIGVAATYPDGTKTDFSNWGGWADIAAPGSNIFSTCKGGTYAIMSGTSMATPIISGACALYMSKVGHVAPKKMKEILTSAVSRSHSKEIGAGIIDLAKLFSEDLTAPKIAAGSITNGVVPYTGSVTISAAEDSSNFSFGDIIYTTDGKNPAVKNGEPVTGTLLGPGKQTIQISDLAAAGAGINKRLTLKAAVITPLGNLTKISTFPFTIGYPDVESVRISPSEDLTVRAGATIQFSAGVLPENALQKVTYSMSPQTSSAVTSFNTATGRLVTKKNTSGTVRISCKSSDGKKKSETITVTIKADSETISGLSLGNDGKAKQLYYRDSSYSEKDRTFCELSVQSLSTGTGKNKTEHTAASEIQKRSYEWLSSNPKIATVKAAGTGADSYKATVTAKGRGSANITCLALDGSGVKAICRVTVNQLVTKITIVPVQSAVAVGNSAAYRVTVLPNNANDKKVIWSSADASKLTVNPGNGRISGISSGSCALTATAEDSRELSQKITDTVSVKVVASKASSLTIDAASESRSYAPYDLVYNRNGQLTSARLYTVNIYDASLPKDETTLQLTKTVTPSTNPVSWSSANQNVATVDDSGKVHAVRTGSTRITCRAQDGSGKSASVNIKVIVPISTIDITLANDQTYIGYGRSATAKAIIGDSYGKPSVTKVTWNIEEYNIYNTKTKTRTKTNKLNGLVSINAGGRINTNKAITDLAGPNDQFEAIVTATATDGTGTQKSFTVTLDEPVKNYILYDTIGTLIFKVTSVKVSMKNASIYYLDGNIYDSPTVTSSNTGVATARYLIYEGAPCILVTTREKTGSARITVRSNDGSNKTCNLNVQVVK